MMSGVGRAERASGGRIVALAQVCVCVCVVICIHEWIEVLACGLWRPGGAAARNTCTRARTQISRSALLTNHILPCCPQAALMNPSNGLMSSLPVLVWLTKRQLARDRSSSPWLCCWPSQASESANNKRAPCSLARPFVSLIGLTRRAT